MLFVPLQLNFSGILIETHKLSLKKMYLKMSSAKCRPFCLGVNMLIVSGILASSESAIEVSPEKSCHRKDSAVFAFCKGKSPVTDGFPHKRPVMVSFDVFFQICPSKQLQHMSQVSDDL